MLGGVYVMKDSRAGKYMRIRILFLTAVLVLTACTAPINPANAPADVADESHRPVLDGTFETSLLAMLWKGGAEGSILFPVDPSSGTALPDYPPISLGYSGLQFFSPDRRTLATVGFADGSTFDGSLLLIDLPSWKTRRFELQLIGWVTSIVFSPDGKQLAIAHGETNNRLTMVDLETGRITSQTKLEPNITKMKFTANGDALMLYGQVIADRFTIEEKSAGAPQVLLLDASDLSTRWSTTLKGVRDGIYPRDESVKSADLYEMGNAVYLSPGLDFAPDGDILYVLHPDSEQLTTVDFGARQVRTVEIEDQLSWFERLLALTAGEAHAKVADGTSKQAVISPDGQFLYSVGVNHASSQDQNGNWQMEQTPLGLEIIQTRDGERLEHLETDATELSLSPDGKYLYLRSWEVSTPWTEVFDLSNLQILAHKEGAFAQPALLMNGDYLLASTYSISESSNQMSVLEGTRLDVISNWSGGESIYWLPAP
jgi:Periplasmic component of the Tol biopolymer transport system